MQANRIFSARRPLRPAAERHCRPAGTPVVSLAEGIDATTPAGKLQLHILGAIAEFERARIRERVKAGLARVRASGKRLGRPATVLAPAAIEQTRLEKTSYGLWRQGDPVARFFPRITALARGRLHLA